MALIGRQEGWKSKKSKWIIFFVWEKLDYFSTRSEASTTAKNVCVCQWFDIIYEVQRLLLPKPLMPSTFLCLLPLSPLLGLAELWSDLAAAPFFSCLFFFGNCHFIFIFILRLSSLTFFLAESKKRGKEEEEERIAWFWKHICTLCEHSVSAAAAASVPCS